QPKVTRTFNCTRPTELERLNSLIANRTNTAPPVPQQGVLNFESATEVATPIDSPFDLRVLKIRDEQVWIVEVRPKAPTIQPDLPHGTTPLSDAYATDLVR